MYIKHIGSHKASYKHAAGSHGRSYYLLALFSMLLALSGNAQSNQWAWMGGASTTNQPGNYGTQGVAAATNQPGARAQAATWTDISGNLWLFGGTNVTSSSMNDLWKYDKASGLWTWVNGPSTPNQTSIYGTQGVADAANRPGARFSSVSWTDASGNLWLLGGIGYASSNQGFLDDLWKYDPSINQWTWVNGVQTTDQAGVYGTKGMAAVANRPGARAYAVSWTDASGKFWLCGGYGYSASGSLDYLNDLWKYDPSANQWTWINGESTGNQVGTYGTKGTPAAANSPGGRNLSVSWTDTSGNFWLFGGFGYGAFSSGPEFLSDLWKYSPSTNQWTWISGSNTSGEPPVSGTKGVPGVSNRPGARILSIAWADASGSFWIFGGMTGSFASLNDLWKYNPATGLWTWMNGSNLINPPGVYGTQGTPAAANTPGGRYKAVRWTDASGKLWLLGGTPDGGNGLNDLWEYFPPAVANPGTSFTVTGGGSYCEGGTGAPVYLNGSEANAIYQLRLNGNNVGSPVPGTGGTISFGNQTAAGTYTAQAINTDGTGIMTGSAVVSINQPVVYAGADVGVCGSDSVTLSASGAVSYVWSNGVPNGAAFVPVTTGTICVTANEGDIFFITAPEGAVFTQVLFASYGTPSGSCGNFAIGNCHASGSQSVMENILLGQNLAGFQVLNDLFGDPCSGTAKRLAVTAAYTIPLGTPMNYIVTGTDANGCSNKDTVSVTALSSPSVSAGADQSVCSGESVILTASGTGSHSWDNGVIDNVPFVPSSTATYTVTNTGSNGCTRTDNVEIEVKPLPMVDAGADHAVCAGSLVSLSASGGAVSYTWDNGISDGVPFVLPASTTYTLTGTGANGCTDTDHVTLDVLQPPNAAVSPSDSVSLCKAVCNNVLLSVPAVAGNTYIWKRNNSNIPGTGSNSLTTTTVGSYEVTVSNSCGSTTSSPVIVTVNSPAAVSISAPVTAICAGNTAVLSGSTANSYQWLWDGAQITGATSQDYDATVSGHYSLVATDNNGCQGVSKAVNVKVSQVPDAGFAVYNVYPNGSLRLRGNQAGLIYQWYRNGSPVSSATGRFYIVTQSGDYHLQVSNGICTAISADTTIVINSASAKMTGGTAASASGSIQVVPNPSSGIFKIMADTPVQAVVKNMQGQALMTTEDEEIDLLSQPAGMYMLELYDMQGTLVKTEKLVKQ